MKQAARSVLFSMAGFAWPVIISLLATPTILHGLGEASYGVWSLVGNVLGYFSILNSLQTAGTKYLAEYLATKDYGSIRKLLGTSLAFNIGVGLTGGIVIFLLARPLAVSVFNIPPELQPQSIIAFQLAGLGFSLSTLGWWGSAILAGMQRFDWLTGVVVLTNTLFVAGSLLAIFLGWGIVGVVIANLAGLIVSAGIYTWIARRLLPKEAWGLELNWKMLKLIFAYGFYSTMQIVFGMIAIQLDRTLLGIWVGTAAVTTYTIPLSVANRIHQLCAKALEVVFPIVSGLEAQNRSDQLRRLFLRAQNLNVVLVIVVSVPLFVLAREILTYWISPEFAGQATLVFQLLIVAYALLALNVAMAAVVGGLGHPEVNMAFAMVLGLGNLLGYILFIPRWGVNGAGAASVFGSIVSIPIFLGYVNWRFLKVRWIEIISTSVIRPTLAGIVIGIGLYFLRPAINSEINMLIALVMAGLFYLGATFVVGTWQPEELALIGQLWHKFRRYSKPAEMVR